MWNVAFLWSVYYNTTDQVFTLVLSILKKHKLIYSYIMNVQQNLIFEKNGKCIGYLCCFSKIQISVLEAKKMQL